MQNNKLKELIQIVEDKSSIVDIISDYINLEKKGNSYVGICPFHPDSNPSMSVSDSKRIFKCFSCGAGGGVISFVQNYEGISFIEALKKLSDKYNINWKEYINQREVKINPDEKRGWEINEEAYNFFSYELNNTSDNEVLNYIKSRNLNKDIIQKFKIGFANQKNKLSTFLINKGFSEDEIIKYGLGKRSANGDLHDYFIQRLIFSIEDINGKIVGFSGRVIKESKYSKYLNSPETPIFKKTNILYNLHGARISSNLKKELIIVEGFMDVISLFKAGIENAIATMGTAFTKSHNKLIKSFTNNVVLAFDSDAPGINATISTGKTLISDGFNVDSVSIPSGKDFDELYNKDPKLVKQVLETKNSFLDFYKSKIFARLDLDKHNISFDILRELLKLISLYNDNLLTDFNLNEISNKYGIDKNILLDEINKFKKHDLFIPNEPVDFVKDKSYENRNYEISRKSKPNSKLIRLMIDEEIIISYILRNDDAFNWLVKNNGIGFTRPETYNLWNDYKNFKLNNIEIKNEETINKINRFINEDYMNKINPELDEIYDLESFKLFVNKYTELLHDSNKEKLLNEIRKTTDIEEKKYLTSLLKKIINKKVV